MEKQDPRIIWITGASSGLGSALAENFGRHGDRVILSARTDAGLRSVSGEITRAGGLCEPLVCDVQKPSSCADAFEKILARHNRIDVLINNAGVTYFKNFLDTSLEEFDHVIQTNLRGIFLMTKSVLPSMLKRNNGLILNILSYAAKKTYLKSSIYAASKAGAAAMMEGLREEIRGRGVKVINVYPGAITTPIWRKDQIARYGDQMMAPEHVASLLYQMTIQPSSLTVEEIILRPQNGDITAS